MARPPPQETPFVELRWSKLLDQPLAVAGQLRHAADDRLERRVERPFRETTTVAGENVTIVREGQRQRRFSLKRAPELRGVLASFAALLAGDAATLRQHFDIVIGGDDARWQLLLTPREARVRKRVAAVTIDGQADAPSCFAVREADGDESVMLVGALATAHAGVVDADAALPTREALASACRGGVP